MKKILFVVFLTVPCAAQAQNTAQAWEFRKETCQWMADMGKQFIDKKARDPAHYMSRRPVAGQFDQMTVFTQWTFDFVTTTTVDESSALRLVFAKCIDNIDRIYRDNGNTLPSQFQ